MKNVKGKFETVGEAAKFITAMRRRAAMDAYFESDAHAQISIVERFCQHLKLGAARIARGEISPQLDLCCCAETFVAALTESPTARYDAIELRGEEEYEFDEKGKVAEVCPPWGDRKLAKDENAILLKANDEKFADYLLLNCDCVIRTYSSAYELDRQIQRGYYDAVVAYLTAAANYALKIASASLESWFEALRLLQPINRDAFPNYRAAEGVLDLNADNVRAAYDVAGKALAKLWTDEQIRRLKTGAKKRRNGAKAK